MKEQMQFKSVKRGELLYQEGEPTDWLYYVISGSIIIRKISKIGKRIIENWFLADDLFGHIEDVQDHFHADQATAHENSVLGIIAKKDLQNFMIQDTIFRMEWLKWAGHMHQLALMKIRDTMLYGKTGALSAVLLRLKNSFGEPHEAGILLNKRITNQLISEMICVSRERVNRMISELKKNNVIEFDSGYIIIKDEAYLRNEVKCEMCTNEICRV